MYGEEEEEEAKKKTYTTLLLVCDLICMRNTAANI